MITKAIKHITIGQTKRLYKPVGYTMLANFINIVSLLSFNRSYKYPF